MKAEDSQRREPGRAGAAEQEREPFVSHPVLTNGNGGKLVEEVGWNRRQEHQIPRSFPASVDHERTVSKP